MCCYDLHGESNPSRSHGSAIVYPLCYIRHFFFSFFKNDAELPKEFGEVKKRSVTPKITWKIMRICCSIQTVSAAFYV